VDRSNRFSALSDDDVDDEESGDAESDDEDSDNDAERAMKRATSIRRR
jgi:hypothetical protein